MEVPTCLPGISSGKGIDESQGVILSSQVILVCATIVLAYLFCAIVSACYIGEIRVNKHRSYYVTTSNATDIGICYNSKNEM